MDIEILRDVPFFAGASSGLLKRLAQEMVEKTFEPNQVILEEGAIGLNLYMIVDGEVEVVKGHGTEQQILANRGPGEVFGEMGAIGARPRFASIRAVKPTRLVEFTAQDMRTAWTEQPQLLYSAVAILASRLRESDRQMMAGLQRKNQELAQAYRELQQAQAALVEKERFERELELARELQQSLLPREFPQIPGFRCAARSRPAWQVGGDFYDVIPLDKDQVGLVIADVSDKGMAAALFMALTRSLVRAEARRNSSPRQVLLNVHRLLLEVSQAEMFVTVFYGVLDLGDGSLCYVRAGHDRPLIRSSRAGTCEFLTARGNPLGMLDDVTIEEARVNLGSGDLLVLYTDGITDALSPSGEFFGMQRLRDTICTFGERDVQELSDLVFERVDQFRSGTAQYDDMALLIVRPYTRGEHGVSRLRPRASRAG